MDKFDVVVIGASTGGTLAAYAALQSGLRVALTERTDWIGGQLTSQAIPPDEHRWIENTGLTASYRRHRAAIRDVYRTRYPLLEQIKGQEVFDPGASFVSHIAHDPRVSLELLEGMLAPYRQSGKLALYLNAQPVSARASGGVVQSVTVRDEKGETTLYGTYFIDGTDTGELLPLCGAAYTIGAESRAMTGEPSAPDTYQSDDIQPVTWAAALRFKEGEDIPMEKPDMYDYFASWKYPFMEHSMLSWYGPNLNQPTGRLFKLFAQEPGEVFPLWPYRRIQFPGQFEPGAYDAEATILNWPQNDYVMGNVTGADGEEQLYRARQHTLSFIYWLKYEAPRPDGGKGYRGISADGSFTGTQDGLAKAPYIRESRRIKGLSTITLDLISKKLAAQAPVFADSVGVGHYHIDLHCTTGSHTLAFWEAHPFEIPLSAMVPCDMENLLPGCKNIATTHLTNGCYRVHPCEWNIGESAGYLAAHAVLTGKTPRQIAQDERETRALQERLIAAGVQLHWPEDIL